LEGKAVFATMMSLLLMFMPASSFPIQSAIASDITLIAIFPASVEDGSPGMIFRVEIVVDVGTNQLWMWVLNLRWNPSVLELVGEPIEGPFLKNQAGATAFFWREINSVEGYLDELLCVSLTGATAMGVGVIAMLDFKVLARGDSVFTLLGPYEAKDPTRPLWLDSSGNEYSFDIVVDGGPQPPTVISATVDIDPDALKLWSKGRWITAYIELPEGYSVNDIIVSSIKLDSVLADLEHTEIGDHDSDNIPDLMVKFSRAEIVSSILNEVETPSKFLNTTLTLIGRLHDRTSLKGNCIVKTIYFTPMYGRTKGIFPI